MTSEERKLLDDAVGLLGELDSLFGGVHVPSCAMVKSNRRKWGRPEKCNCGVSRRNEIYVGIVNRYVQIK